MMIRRWYRTVLFWLGMPGFLFILWVWWQSNLQWIETYLEPGWIFSGRGELLWHDSVLPPSLIVDDRERGPRRIESSDGSSETFGTLTYQVTPSIRWDTFTTGPIEREKRRWFPLPQWQVKEDPNGDPSRRRSLPYWLLTTGYAGVWLGGLAGWQRRKARLLKSSATTPLP